MPGRNKGTVCFKLWTKENAPNIAFMGAYCEYIAEKGQC